MLHLLINLIYQHWKFNISSFKLIFNLKIHFNVSFVAVEWSSLLLTLLKAFFQKVYIHYIRSWLFIVPKTDSFFIQQEDDSDCGSGTSLSPCLWPILGLQLLLLWHLSSPQPLWPPSRCACTLSITLHKRPEDMPTKPSGTEAGHFQGDIFVGVSIFSDAKGCSFTSSSSLSKVATL